MAPVWKAGNPSAEMPFLGAKRGSAMFWECHSTRFRGQGMHHESRKIQHTQS